MKNKILYGIMAFVMGLCLTACSDDDIAVNTTPLLKDGSVVTGSPYPIPQAQKFCCLPDGTPLPVPV